MSNITYFQIGYDGPSLQNHEISVNDLAPALLAVGDLLEETNNILYGEKSRVYVNVKGSFKTGSFLIDFATAQNFLSGMTDMFSKQTPALQILILLGIIKATTDGIESITKIGDGTRKLYGGLIQLLLFIKNRSIKRITKSSEKGIEIIEINDGEKIAVESDILKLLSSIKIRTCLETIINKFLSKEGIEKFTVGREETVTTVIKEEKDYFITPEAQEKIVEDQTIDTTLQAITVSFDEGYKWRFTDGQAVFMANVRDEEFVNKIKDNKVTFAKGDALKVKLHKKVSLSAYGLKPEYEIISVTEHIQVGRQIDLPFSNKK